MVPSARRRGLDTDWASSIGYLLRHTTRLLLRFTEGRVAGYGITLQQYFFLRSLWEMHEPTQRELAASLAMEESHLAVMIDALEGAGLVKRRKSTKDRRKTHVVLTPAARRLRERLLAAPDAVLPPLLEQVFVGVSNESISEMRRSLITMSDNLEALMKESPLSRFEKFRI